MKFLLSVIAFILILFLVGILLGYTLNSIRCNSIADRLSKNWDYNILSGCFIETNSGFVPLKNYVIVD